jgi:hypothetical protein
VEVVGRARTGAIAPLELDSEIARYGATTRGGVGISIPVA